MKVTFKQIEVFVSIAKMGSMTQAAEALFMTQSACSMALTTFENRLGGCLFDRKGKKLILNERGKVIFPKAANILTNVNELSDLMLGTNETLAGHLRVGASTTISNYILPQIIGEFVTTHPKSNITLQSSNTEQIIKNLLKFTIDLGMIEGECYSDKIETIPWKTDELIIIASANDPLSKIKKITREDLNNANWILRESGSGTRAKFENAMGGSIQPFLELGHTEAIKQAVKSGYGISCLSKTAVDESIKNGQLVELKTPFLKLQRYFYILLNKEKYKTEVLNTFVETCRNTESIQQ